MLNKKPEILAPVGGPEQLIAAVRSGANAVYLGTKGFNARQNAKNFDYAALHEAVSYCHGRGVRVHVTVNTLVQDSELDAVLEEIEGVAASGADAVIIQDLGVMRLFKECCPTIERHASTQMAIHNTDGAKLARDLGFSRVVLARELSLKEIEKIASSVDIELESFIHGAHCMSLSGACYMSSIIGERSGNRGLCAQPCRTDFVCGSRNYVLSLKDMSYIRHTHRLIDAGVTSFKIEGRMKRPEYVAAAVTACRKALAGEEYDMDQLEAVFSRSGFTDGYLTGRRNITMFGRRTEADEQRTKAVLGSIAKLYRGEYQAIDVSLEFEARTSQPMRLKASDGVRITEVTGQPPQQAINRAADEEYITRQLSKSGGTPFGIKSIAVHLDEGLAIPASALNQLRRDALERLLEQRSAVTPHPFTRKAFDQPSQSAGGTGVLWARFESADQLPEDTSKLEKIILPLKAVTGQHIAEYGQKLAAELPSALFPDNEDDVRRTVAALKSAGLCSVYCENIYAAAIAREYDVEFIAGPCLNIMNGLALDELFRLGAQHVTLCFELSMSRAKRLAVRGSCGLTVYGRLPLMTVRACPAKGKNGCEKCNGRPVLTDRKGIDFPLLCRDKRYGVIVNSLPLYLADRDTEGFDYRLLYFTTETSRRCSEVIADYIRGVPAPEGEFTRGLYYRNVK